MKTAVLISILLLFSGCVGGHYYRVEEGAVSFYLSGHEANHVYFASSLDGYELHELHKVDVDTWEIQVPSDREFKYFYIVDEALYIPPCRMTEKDDFGLENCIYVPGM